MEKLSRRQILSLPNGLTVLRILAIPVILVLVFEPGEMNRLLTALLFVLAAITDSLDGYLARRHGLVTTLGTFLDPLADKLLIVTALIALVPARGVPVWMVIILVGREIAVTGLRGIAVSQGMVISAGGLGKLKTFFEVIAVTLFILGKGAGTEDVFTTLGLGFFWGALVFAVLSGVGYFKAFLKTIIA
jgi:CDP-diacylglycerol--glycerol-3-phosphate 3-phosphatidyltransferase